MTQEQMERAIEFILNHQAQFSADMGLLQDSMKELQATIAGLSQTQKRTDERLEQIAVHQANLSEIMVALAQGQNALTAAQKHANETLADTNERLNAVILMFERHLTGHHGGGPA